MCYQELQIDDPQMENFIEHWSCRNLLSRKVDCVIAENSKGETVAFVAKVRDQSTMLTGPAG